MKLSTNMRKAKVVYFFCGHGSRADDLLGFSNKHSHFSPGAQQANNPPDHSNLHLWQRLRTPEKKLLARRDPISSLASDVRKVNSFSEGRRETILISYNYRRGKIPVKSYPAKVVGSRLDWKKLNVVQVIALEDVPARDQ